MEDTPVNSSLKRQHTKCRRIALTGASGYLGQHVLYHWMTTTTDHDDPNDQQLDNDHDDDGEDSRPVEFWQVFALYATMSDLEELITSLAATSQPKNRHRQVEVCVESLDLTDPIMIDRWVASHLPLDICIHTAAISNPGICEERPEYAHAVNVPQHFLRRLAHHGIPIVALSTDQVFDGTKSNQKQNHVDNKDEHNLECLPSLFYTETDTPNPINCYGQTKVALEQLLQDTCPQSHVSLRSSIILGPLAPLAHDKVHSTFLHFCASRENQFTDFFVDECRTVVSIQNVIMVLTYFCYHPPNNITSGIYHMGGRDRVSRYDMAQQTFEHLGMDVSFVKPALKESQQQQQQQPNKVKSPLDISMNSSKLARLLKKTTPWHGLVEILQHTFPTPTRPAKDA